MYLIKGHIISSLYFALSTSSFTLLFLLNVLCSCTLSGSGNKIKSNQIKSKLEITCVREPLHILNLTILESDFVLACVAGGIRERASGRAAIFPPWRSPRGNSRE